MKSLNGKELAEFIQERQARQVRALVQSKHVEPRLAIVLTIDHPTINVYIRMKRAYGAELGVAVDVHAVTQDDAPAMVKQLNEDSAVHGIIVQLPLERPEETDQLVDQVAPQKDVDALGKNAVFEPATPLAILWLLAGYNIDLQQGKRVLLVGRGKLVGAPLEKILQQSGVDVHVADRTTANLKAEVLHADVVITATGAPGLLHADMFKPNAVVVDAGVASEGGKTVGDLAPDVYERDDLSITPTKGGVGPLTVCALFDNVIRAAQNASAADAKDKD